MPYFCQNLWVQLSLSQKLRGQFDPLHPSNEALEQLVLEPIILKLAKKQLQFSIAI